MTSVRDLLTGQRSALEDKIALLMDERNDLWMKVANMETRITELRQEISNINAALKAVGEGRTNRPPKIMEAVLEVLKGKPDGMTAQEILAEINEKFFDGKIVRPSLSPQLSRLKDRDKKVELRGNRWFRLPDQPSLFPPIKRRV